MAKEIVETPLMKQYFEMKAKHPDAVLLFRVGDFYETFSDDAITASEILGITLTRRANGVAQSVELAGFPHHALDTICQNSCVQVSVWLFASSSKTLSSPRSW